MSFYQAEPMQDWKLWPLSRWHGEPAIMIIKGNIKAGLKAVKVNARVVEGGKRKEEEQRYGLNNPGCYEIQEELHIDSDQLSNMELDSRQSVNRIV